MEDTTTIGKTTETMLETMLVVEVIGMVLNKIMTGIKNSLNFHLRSIFVKKTVNHF